MTITCTISPCLWFDDQAEQAAQFYVSVFKASRVIGLTRYGKAGFEVHGRAEGSVMSVLFELAGQPFTALNGGPLFKFNEAVSLQIICDSQEEIDYYWDRLGRDGDPQAQQCGWLKDRFGVSWQVLPRLLQSRVGQGDARQGDRIMTALLKMKKLDIAALERAFEGD